MGYGVDLLDCDAALYWWSDMMTGGIQPAIDRVFEERDHDEYGFPYAYLRGRMAIRMLIDSELYVRATCYLWALDLHDKAIRALMLMLNDTRYVDHWSKPEWKAELVGSMQADLARLTATRQFLADGKRDDI